MDYVRKKAFNAQLKKVTKPFESSSNSHRTPLWPAFGHSSPTKQQDSDAQVKTFDVAIDRAFDESPKNFPPLLHLCYIDNSILSDAAVAPVKWASRIFFWFVVLLFLNTAVAILFVIFDKGSGWLRLSMSASATILFSICQLVLYETAFKGAYSTSANLRKRYLLFSGMNIPLISLYAFLGVSFFNGWIRLQRVGMELNGTKLVLRKVFVVLESLGWTALLFANTYTLFEYYHLFRNEVQGLSPSALEAASKRIQAREKEMQLGGGGIEDPKRAKVQEIRDRYNIS